MTILGSASLPKKLYSEDLIKSGFDMLKAQLSSVVYPSLDPDRSPLGSQPLEENIATLIRKILTGASSAFAGIAAFLNQEDATEATVINAVYIAIVPFFSEQGVKGKAKDLSGALEMKVVRSQALGIIRVVSSPATVFEHFVPNASSCRSSRDTLSNDSGSSKRCSRLSRNCLIWPSENLSICESGRCSHYRWFLRHCILL